MSTTKLNQLQLNDYSFASGLARNSIINGNFDVWQRGTSSTTAGGAVYTADRWFRYDTGGTGTLPTITTSRQAITAGAIFGSFYNLRLAFNGASANLSAGAENSTYTKIEYGTRNLCGDGKKVTVSFWAKSDLANKRIGVWFAQNYGSGGSPTAQETINGGNFTLTSSWQKFTLTITTNTLTGKTFGTANDDALWLIFQTAWGSSFSARNGSASVEDISGAGFVDIAQVQLCAGDVALPFMPKSYEEELRACQRYYQLFSCLTIANTDTYASCSQNFQTPMRTIPTIANQAYTLDIYGVGQLTTTLTFSSNNVENNRIMYIQRSSGTGFTPGGNYGLLVILTAEL